MVRMAGVSDKQKENGDRRVLRSECVACGGIRGADIIIAENSGIVVRVLMVGNRAVAS